MSQKPAYSKFIKDFLAILIGNTIYSLGIVAFLLPNQIITGGTTGLALSVQHYFGLPISAFALLFNAAMFILGAAVLGKAFALTTLVSSFYYPFILDVLQRIPALASVTQDKMLAAVCAGLLIGIGIGIVIRAGASTGGMDIPPLILKRFMGIPVSVSLYVFDILILMIQMTFSDIEESLYGVLLVLIYTFVLDKVLTLGMAQTQVKIVSKKYEEINTAINRELDRGSTLIQAETGYLRRECPIVLSVITNRELIRLNKMVMDIDPTAFMIISKVNEVKGKGFTLPKVPKAAK
ncbi:MAG: YitT family protein [Eubacteriales bacterium]|nr:YitT family protein [Eubacteriales bacterium]